MYARTHASTHTHTHRRNIYTTTLHYKLLIFFLKWRRNYDKSYLASGFSWAGWLNGVAASNWKTGFVSLTNRFFFSCNINLWLWFRGLVITVDYNSFGHILMLMATWLQNGHLSPSHHIYSRWLGWYLVVSHRDCKRRDNTSSPCQVLVLQVFSYAGLR